MYEPSDLQIKLNDSTDIQKFNIHPHSLLTAIIESSNDAIISMTLDGTVISWNLSAERIFGYTKEEILGKHISILIPEVRRNEEEHILSLIKSGKKVNQYKTVRLTKGGKEVLISLNVSPIHDLDGKIIGASKIAHDITFITQGEQRQAMLAAIVDSSDDIIISKTLDGFITSWNNSATRLFGYTESEVLGRHISILIPENRLDEETEIITKIRSGQRIEHFETRRVTKDKREIPLSISVSPIIDKDGQIIGASKIARDISERLQNEEKLQRYYQQIEEISASKDEFIGVASHELKTPLTSITAYLQLLERTSKEDQTRKFLKKATTQAAKLSNLVSDLLDVSKIESGKLIFSFSDHKVDEILNSSISVVQDTVSSHKIRMTNPYPDLYVKADAQRLEQVVINFLTNAIKYSPQAEVVDVIVNVVNNRVEISVKDYGIGISEEHQQKIFDRYYRAEDLPNTFSGLGIGLFISKEIVVRHHGHITLQSQPGEGSTFTISLPIKDV